MNAIKLISLLSFALLIGIDQATAQIKDIAKPAVQQSIDGGEIGPIRSSAAYAEILLRKTELQAEIESVVDTYTDENPRMIDLRFEITALDRSLQKVFGVKPSETGKLTAALGKLIVKKASIETELARLSRRYDKDHPEIKKAKRRVEIFESAVGEILK